MDLSQRAKLFKKELRSAEESGDPLTAWTNYLEWMEQNGLTCHCEYMKTLQKCTSYFDEKEYYNTDIRLANVYIKLASLLKEPEPMFESMLGAGVGVLHAVSYEAYSQLMEAKGRGGRAEEVLVMGLERKAQPAHRLTKKLEQLRARISAESAKLPVAQPKRSHPIHKKSEDARKSSNSTRDASFYEPMPGTQIMYPKRLVYPQEGGELQLEMLRARWPCYAPKVVEEEEDCDGMEFTEACPDFHPGAESSYVNGELYVSQPKERKPLSVLAERAEGRNKDVADDVDQELEMLSERKPLSVRGGKGEREGEGNRKPEVQPKERKPLSVLADRAGGRSSELGSADDVERELEMLSQSGRGPPCRPTDQQQTRGVEEDLCDFDVGSELAKLQMEDGGGGGERSQAGGAGEPGQGRAPPCPLDNQENRVNYGTFTPGIAASNMFVPPMGASDPLAARLNFSEMDSICNQSSHLHSQLDHSSGIKLTAPVYEHVRKPLQELAIGGGGGQGGGAEACPTADHSASYQVFADENQESSYAVFHDSQSAKMPLRNLTTTKRQVLGELSCAAAGCDQSPNQSSASMLQAAAVDESSIAPFHDSWANHSKSITGRRNQSVYEEQESSIAPFHDSWANHSKSIAGTSRKPGGVYEEQESSIAPFHDSWANHSKSINAFTATNEGGRPSAVKISVQMLEEQEVCSERCGGALGDGDSDGDGCDGVEKVEESCVYHVALEARVMGGGGGGEEERTRAVGFEVSLAEATFTQIDIKHPNEFNPTSTPSANHDATLNYTAVEEKRQENAFNLSTIIEETGSYKSSSSNATGSSGGGSLPTDSLTPCRSLVNSPHVVNPFLPEQVNAMLNSQRLSVAQGSLTHVSMELPKQMKNVCMCGEVYPTRKLTSGGFATIYTTKDKSGVTHALKVQSPAHKWEMSVLSGLADVLKGDKRSAWFMELKPSYVFSNASILVSPYYPDGTLLDLANAHHSQRMHIEECVLVYYALEVLGAVGTLHSLGVIHADIKPDNIMIRDIRGCGGGVANCRGAGVCLIDFGRAIDVWAFPEHTMFEGSNETDGFQCVQMLENKPWKWQADYFGSAACLYVLMYGSYMQVSRSPVSGLYQPQRTRHMRMYDPCWSKLYEKLLNCPAQVAPAAFIKEASAPLEAKIKTVSQFIFHSWTKKALNTLAAYLKKKPTSQ